MVRLRCMFRTMLFLMTLIMGLSWVPFGVVWAGLNDGLVAYYPFDGNAQDESENGNHGTVHGATLTEDKFGNASSAYYFDGVNDFIQINHSFELTPENYTAVVWYKADADKLGEIITKGIDKHYYQIQFKSGVSGFEDAIEFWYEDQNDADHHILSQEGFVVGQYIMATMIYENQVLRAYINDLFIAEQTFMSAPYNDGDDLYIGKGNGGFFSGVIDDIRIYNRALTDS